MAAGLGFKTFTTGEVLTAADTNGYLMQGVLVFASAAARDAAITSPQEGQCCYLKDTDAVLTYSGAAWVGFDDSNAIQNTIVDAKGDIVAASGSDTPARLAVGNNGETLVADSSTATGLAYREDYAAGKNKIINGDFRINQRNFSSTTTNEAYGFDRFMQRFSGACTYSSQTFTPGTAPAAPYEAINFARLVSSAQVGATDFAGLLQRIEDVRTLANEVVTFSFWAKASTGTPNIGVTFGQNFGSGGSSAVNTSPAVKTITTSWVRYSFQITVPSISGKTVGTNSMVEAYIFTSCGTSISALGYAAVGLQNVTIDIWGVQLETGSVATAFQTATGTLQGELAACQRYFQLVGTSAGNATTTTIADMQVNVMVPLRATPTVSQNGVLSVYDDQVGAFTQSAVSLSVIGTFNTLSGIVRLGNFTGMTANRLLISSNSNNNAITLSSEL